MLVPNQLIEVRVSAKSYRHYNALGYNVKNNDIIHIPPNHLQRGSHIEINVICDVCGEIILKPYCYYLRDHTYNLDCCTQCKHIKTEMTWQNKYGINNVAKLDSMKQKAKSTCLERYESDCPIHNDEIKAKMQRTNLEKYGVACVLANSDIKERAVQSTMEHYGVKNPFELSEIQQQARQTLFEHYGVYNSMQCEEIKNKTKETMLKRYGVEWATQSPIIKEKIRQSFYQNKTTPTSKQQVWLYEIIKKEYPEAELNYPFSTCSLDIFICVKGVNIDIEYDGNYWHKNRQKDIKRDKFLQSQGFKTLRIRSGHLLPTKEELFDAINYLVNTEHHFKEIILSDWMEGELCHAQLQVVV